MRRLAARCGRPAPDLPALTAGFDLVTPQLVLWAEPWLGAALERVDPAAARAGLTQALGRAARRPGAPVACFASEDEALRAFAGATVLEPLGEPAELQARIDAARAAGHRVLLDERRTAFRAAATTIAAALARGPDLVLFGASLAGGLPFAAIVGSPSGGPGDAVATSVAAAVVSHLLERPRHEEFVRRAAQLTAAVRSAAQVHEVSLTVDGLAAMPAVRLHDQESAEGPLIGHHFGLELAAVGCRVDGPLLVPPQLADADLQRLVRNFEHAVARVRTLLIEYNSYLSGGLPFVFPGGCAALRARGVTRYRYPRLAEVDVDPHGDAIRIEFAAGELGPVTSSGFYVPTRLCGDVDVQVRYVAPRFSSGPDATCLGLFLQNEASTARYYAQLMSTCDAPDARSVALGHAGAVIGRRAVPGQTGWLRLARRGGRVHAFHREVGDADWHELGSVPATADELVVGAKIWSKQRTDGLVADLFDLRVDAELAAVQPELLGARPDPRSDASNR